MYYLYIIECVDKSLYTGITTDVERRVEEHNTSVRGAKYTSSRRPVRVVFSEKHSDRSSASKKEAQIKKLSKREKLIFINSGLLKNSMDKEFQKEIRKLKNIQKAKVLAGFFKT